MNITAIRQAMKELREQGGYLYEDATTFYFNHAADGGITLLGARTSTGHQATPRDDIGQSWTRICREDLVGAYQDYLAASATPAPTSGWQSLTLMG